MKNILKWFFRRKERSKNKKTKETEKAEKEQYEIMPNFRNKFLLLPTVIKAAIIPEDTTPYNTPSVQDHAAAKSIAEKEARAAHSSDRVKDVFTRIQTTKSRNYEIIWLLRTDEDVPYKSVGELIESYNNVKDRDAFRGMSVNYASNGKLYEISPLHEQDLAGLAKKLESGKKAGDEVS